MVTEQGIRILSLGTYLNSLENIGDDVDGGNKDSGGPGTYSQLLIIKEYMVRLANDLGINEGDVYPADYFDLMGGVGFGGLVAILLGHLWMNVDEAIDGLLNVALAIFPDDPGPEPDQEARNKQLRESVTSILQTRGIPLDQKMQDTSQETVGCKVALYAATAANISHPIVLRNYKARRPSLNPSIVEAVCATMSFPSHFSPIHIGPHGRHQVFIGGPRGANNPTRELLKEASTIFGKDKLVSQIVSLGCGRSRIPSVESNTTAERFGRSIEEMAADCEAVAKELSMRLYDMETYLRLNVDRGMENLLLNEWDDLGSIETHTSSYVETAEISETIEASLRRLQGRTGNLTLGEINHPSAAKDVQDKLDEQKKKLDGTYKGVKDNEDSRILDRLKPVDAPSYYESRCCMKDTRTHILDRLLTWVEASLKNNDTLNGFAPEKIFWLYGSPGLGKTSIANSLCHQLHMAGRLGGSFFCRRDDPVACDPNRVLSTLLYRLSWMWSPYRDLVVQALRGDPNLNPDWTGCALLLQHLYSLQNHPNTVLVLVVDALDESGDRRTRAPLLRCLSEICTHIEWIKIVVTSRPEHDVSHFFQGLGLIGHDLSKDEQAHEDIRIFTRYRMDSLAKQYHLSSDWPGESRLEQITRLSGGLFIFVETLYRLLDDPDPELLLTQALGGMLGEANAALHKLYSTAIETRIGRNKGHFRLFAQALVAVATHRSLPDKALASLIGLEPGVVSSWVDGLGSLLYRDVLENGGIRARHLSVIEFLTSPTCPLEFRVEIQEANGRLGYRCLITMAKELKFNICELETSCALNADVQNLNNRVQDKISDALQYSCMHWSSHLCSDATPPSEKVSELLDIFLAGAQLLYWLEVLSLMGKVPVGILALRLMKEYFKKFEDRHQRLAEDALRFMLAFFTPISTSVPHIYISSVPFMPMESHLWKRLSVLFPELMEVYKGRMKFWPAPSGIWQGHTDSVLCAVYSPDGQNVISSSGDYTIRVWDSQTGEAVGEPLKGHTDYVRSVVYSPDGRKILSGSDDKTLRIWDAQTGVAIGEPLRGHTDYVRSVAYSPDGRNVLSGSDDKTVRIWDAQKGALVGEPLKGHVGSVYSVAYSPDGRNIVSGSSDKTLRIWDAQTGAAVGEPQSGHTDYVRSVAYSPDGRNVISASADSTIRIWDARTGKAVGEPLQGHTGSVYGVVYSPDGRNVLSGSDDGTIRIWDAQTGVIVGQPMKERAGSVYSVAYSPDGRGIVSGFSDNMIRVYNAETGNAVGEPPRVHTDYVRSVAYSPNGLNIISGSGDSTIRIWDAQTGEPVGKPLQGHSGPVCSVAYSPDGQKVLSGSDDGTIRIWDARTRSPVGGPLKGHVGSVYSIAPSPDGRNLISGSEDNAIRIWDTQTGVSVGRPVRGHTGSIHSIAYSPDGRNIISGADDNAIRIWNARTGEAVGEPLRGHTENIRSVAYSPDGQNIVSGSDDKMIRIWDAQTGAAVGEPLRGHAGWVYSVAYAPDSQKVVSGSSDKTIRIWDTQTGTAVGEPLRGHTNYVLSVTYSPDGRNIVSGSSDNTIRIWDAQIEVGIPLRRNSGDVLKVTYSQSRQNVAPHNTIRTLDAQGNMGKAAPGPLSDSSNRSDTQYLNAYSGLPIPEELLDSNGWIRGADGLLFWVPEDCRHGLICPAIITIPNMGRERCVRIDFSRFQCGTLWTRTRQSSSSSF